MATATPTTVISRNHFLEGAVADGRHHQEREHQDQRRNRPQPHGFRNRGIQVVEGDDQRDQHSGRERNRQPDEIPLGPRFGVGQHVEAREADGAAGRVDRADGDSGRPDPGQRPLVNEDGRRDSERDHVRERVQLDAEVALGARQPRHPPVERIEEAAEEDRHRRSVEVVARGLARRERDRVHAAKNAAHREEVGEHEHQLA